MHPCDISSICLANCGGYQRQIKDFCDGVPFKKEVEILHCMVLGKTEEKDNHEQGNQHFKFLKGVGGTL